VLLKMEKESCNKWQWAGGRRRWGRGGYIKCTSVSNRCLRKQTNV